MTPAEWDTVARIGLPVVVSTLFLGLAVPVLRAVLLRGLREITHGDGNGAPSLQQIEQRIDAIQAEVREVRAEVRTVTTNWAECRRTPGCPHQEMR